MFAYLRSIDRESLSAGQTEGAVGCGEFRHQHGATPTRVNRAGATSGDPQVKRTDGTGAVCQAGGRPKGDPGRKSGLCLPAFFLARVARPWEVNEGELYLFGLLGFASGFENGFLAGASVAAFLSCAGRCRPARPSQPLLLNHAGVPGRRTRFVRQSGGETISRHLNLQDEWRNRSSHSEEGGGVTKY